MERRRIRRLALLVGLVLLSRATTTTVTLAFSPSAALTTTTTTTSVKPGARANAWTLFQNHQTSRKPAPQFRLSPLLSSPSDVHPKEESAPVDGANDDEASTSTPAPTSKVSNDTTADNASLLMMNNPLAGSADTATVAGSKMERFRNMIPVYDALDKTIIKNAIPSMVNLAVVPLVNSVDTFWVGRMGIALALAGQAAANQAFFTIFFLVNYLPTITAPLVASAVGSGDMEQAQKRVGESLFLSNLLGGLGTLLLVAFPTVGLSLILPDAAPALDYARPYLRFRALSMVPALVGATGFAAFRGSLDTVTPLKVSLFTK